MKMDNPAVRKAYEDKVYTDTTGAEWKRGMDGWFLENIDGRGGIMLARHHDFVALVEKEHPMPEKKEFCNSLSKGGTHSCELEKGHRGNRCQAESLDRGGYVFWKTPEK